MNDYKNLAPRKELHSNLIKACVKAESTAAGYLLCTVILVVMGLTGS